MLVGGGMARGLGQGPLGNGVGLKRRSGAGCRGWGRLRGWGGYRRESGVKEGAPRFNPL